MRPRFRRSRRHETERSAQPAARLRAERQWSGVRERRSVYAAERRGAAEHGRTTGGSRLLTRRDVMVEILAVEYSRIIPVMKTCGAFQPLRAVGGCRTLIGLKAPRGTREEGLSYSARFAYFEQLVNLFRIAA